MVIGKKPLGYQNYVSQIFGTGCLIGPKLVLTCAHNCYYARGAKHIFDIEFIPSQIVSQIKDNRLSGRGFKVKKAIFPDNYQKENHFVNDKFNKGHLYDIALLELETDLNLEEYFGTISYDFEW